MSRSVSQLLASILLGAITTLVISWACAAWIDPNRAALTFSALPGANNSWQGISIQSCFGHTRINRSTLFNLTRDPATNAIQTIGLHGNDANASSEDLSGWPWRAMRCDNAAEITIGDGSALMQSRKSGIQNRIGLIELRPWIGGPGPSTWRALPDRPMWPGFAIDTVLYASLWWFLMFGLLALRRGRRRRLGLCPRCGYDLRGQPGDQKSCPECGLLSTLTPMTT